MGMTLWEGLLCLWGSAHRVLAPSPIRGQPSSTLTQGDTGHTQHRFPCPPESTQWPGRSPHSPCGACISGNLLWKTSPQGKAHSRSHRLWCRIRRTDRGGRGWENTSDYRGLHSDMLAVATPGCPSYSSCKVLSSSGLSLSLLLSTF